MISFISRSFYGEKSAGRTEYKERRTLSICTQESLFERFGVCTTYGKLFIGILY